jgi:hypothetical protein
MTSRPLHGGPIRIACRTAAPPGEGVTPSRQATDFTDQVVILRSTIRADDSRVVLIGAVALEALVRTKGIAFSRD